MADVSGDVDLSFLVDGQQADASDVTIPFNDVIGIFNDMLNGVQAFDQLVVDGGAVFNEGGAAADFRVEGATNPNLLFLDGSADTVSIGAIPDSNTGLFQVGGGGVVTNNNANARGAKLSVDFESNQSGMGGIGLAPSIRPSANMSTAFGIIGTVKVFPALDASSYDITTAYANYYRLDTFTSYSGTITNVYGTNIGSPVVDGGTVSNAVGIRIQKPTAAVNNFYMEFDTADATDPTGGGGAAAGRLAIKVGGVTRYLAYY